MAIPDQGMDLAGKQVDAGPIATRYDKRAINFLAGIYLAAVMTFNPVLANQKPGYKPSWIT
jgi:hypothetical protein